MKIVNRKKFVTSSFVIIGVILGILFGISNISLSHGETSYKTIYISNGDTLWNIARSEINNNEYYSNKDIRDVVENIKDINKLSNTSLKVGQELQIPVI